MCAAAAQRVARAARPAPAAVAIPATLSARDGPRTSTQAALGRALLDLSRVEGVAERLVTVSPDVSISTNLGGFINKVGVWGLEEETVYDAMEDSPLRWRVGPRGQHIEMGIAEMNLVLLLGQLGLSWDVQGETVFPIGTLYDPFVMRALEGIVYSVYSGSRFILAGTPSGISLSREGGAHQSINTPGIGIETPSLTYAEPCYAREFEWLLLDALERLQEPKGGGTYLRLSTTPIAQEPFAAFVARVGDEQRAGGCRRGRVPAARAAGTGGRPGDPRRLRRDHAGASPRRRPALGGRGRRGDGALPVVPRPALSRLARGAGAAAAAASRRDRAISTA